MNTYQFIASHHSLKEKGTSNVTLLSYQEVKEQNIPASKLTETFKTTDPTEKNLLYFSSNTEKDFEVIPDNPKLFAAFYTEKKYISKISWIFSLERAKKLLEYIKDHFNETKSEEVELWSIPEKIRNSAKIRTLSLDEVSLQDMEDLFGEDPIESPKGIVITNY